MKDIEDRNDIKRLIDTFYGKLLKDQSISHFFTKHMTSDLSDHLPIMYDYWESVLLGAAKYKGNPMKVHLDLNDKSPIENQHFKIWVSHFKETIDEFFKGQNAETAKQRAQSIAFLIQHKTNGESRGLL